jgi:ParB family chromosome partitioning protein
VTRPGGLGKGLGALIPAEATAGPSALQEIPISEIRPNPHQPRDYFDEEALGSLAESIREVGVLQPVLVRAAGNGYELIAGERRWRASRRVGLQRIPAIIRTADDATALEHALVENLHRSDLNPLEEAAAYQQLIEDFALTHDEVAGRVGRSRASISNMLRLLQLPPSIQRSLQTGQLSMGHARALLGTPDRGFQEQLAKRAAAEGMSVRNVEEAVRLHGDGTPMVIPDPPANPVTRLRPAGLLELEELLGDHLDTRVTVSMSGKKGKVVVEFSDLEDLERIYRAMTEAAAVEA